MLPPPSYAPSCLALAAVSASPASPAYRSCVRALRARSPPSVLSLLSSPRGCFREPPFPPVPFLRIFQPAFFPNSLPASFLRNSLPASFLHSIDHAWAIKDADCQVPSASLTRLPFPPRLADFSKKHPSLLHISKNYCTFAPAKVFDKTSHT